jgi:hypothetical protein
MDNTHQESVTDLRFCPIGKRILPYFTFGMPMSDRWRIFRKYYRPSSEQGNAVGVADGHLNDGLCLENRIGIEVNPEQTLKYCRLSSNKGNALAQISYVFCLENGIEIEPNDDGADVMTAATTRGGSDFGACCAEVSDAVTTDLTFSFPDVFPPDGVVITELDWSFPDVPAVPAVPAVGH